MTAFISKKHFLHATKALTNAITLGEGPLRDVEGLSDLRNDLEKRRTQLYTKLLDELSKILYQSSTGDALTNFQRHGSGRGSNYSGTSSSLVSPPPFQRNMVRRSTDRIEANSKVKRALFEMSQGFDVDKTEVIEDADLIDPELNSTYFIGIIIECFALLNKVPESLEVSYLSRL